MIPQLKNGNFNGTWYTVKLFNLAALKVGDLACKIILAPFILANQNHTIRNTVVISSYFGLQLIFMPFNFAVLFGPRNSRNKGHANIKGFTVYNWASVLEITRGLLHRLKMVYFGP